MDHALVLHHATPTLPDEQAISLEDRGSALSEAGDLQQDEAAVPLKFELLANEIKVSNVLLLLDSLALKEELPPVGVVLRGQTCLDQILALLELDHLVPVGADLLQPRVDHGPPVSGRMCWSQGKLDLQGVS